MRVLLLKLGFVCAFFAAQSLTAQDSRPIPAPPDVHLQLMTENGQTRFRLGERVGIRYSVYADVAGKYTWVSLVKKLEGGQDFAISCSPPAQTIDTLAAKSESGTLWKVLHASCGGGVEGGSGGGCGDCDSEQRLTSQPLEFGDLPLNAKIRFPSPGSYSCTASAANVTSTRRSDKVRPALLVNSNSISITLNYDPSWALSAAQNYGASFQKLCARDESAGLNSLKCFDLAQRITYLDTLESLALEVKFFDGRRHSWENGFWDAIRRSAHPEEALQEMTRRIQDPDFEVSAAILESLAAWDLRQDSPDAFQSAPSAANHKLAVEKMRKYLRLLGSSLHEKNSVVLVESAKAYASLAEETYCEEKPLIPPEEELQILSALRLRP